MSNLKQKLRRIANAALHDTQNKPMTLEWQTGNVRVLQTAMQAILSEIAVADMTLAELNEATGPSCSRCLRPASLVPNPQGGRAVCDMCADRLRL